MPEVHGQQPATNQVPPRITPASEVPRPKAADEGGHGQPRLITVKQLGANTAGLIEELAESGESAIIVRHGKLLATLSPISGDDLLHEAFGRRAQELPDAQEIKNDDHSISISIEELRSRQLGAIDMLAGLDLDVDAGRKQDEH